MLPENPVRPTVLPESLAVVGSYNWYVLPSASSCEKSPLRSASVGTVV